MVLKTCCNNGLFHNVIRTASWIVFLKIRSEHVLSSSNLCTQRTTDNDFPYVPCIFLVTGYNWLVCSVGWIHFSHHVLTGLTLAVDLLALDLPESIHHHRDSDMQKHVGMKTQRTSGVSFFISWYFMLLVRFVKHHWV